jgi:NAD-dependent deacetylase
MRPDVVWFGEALPMDVYHAAVQAAAECDLFLTVGTSAVVYPAAGIIDWAISAGARTIEVNLESTPLTRMVTVALHGKAGEILPMVTEG